MSDLLRLLAPPLLAALTAGALDRLMAKRDLLPPLFRYEPGDENVLEPTLRRASASLLLFVMLWITVFAPLGALGTSPTIDIESLARPQLFLVHAILTATLVIWFVLGFVRFRSGLPSVAGSPRYQFGLTTRSLGGEFGLGVLCGIAAWVAVLTLLIGLGVLIWILGGEEALPKEPPAVVPWIAGLPLILRLAVSASAGFAEELFFRGFLQPRVGIALSTGLFAMAHLSYDQPLMLVGITLLS